LAVVDELAADLPDVSRKPAIDHLKIFGFFWRCG